MKKQLKEKCDFTFRKCFIAFFPILLSLSHNLQLRYLLISQQDTKNPLSIMLLIPLSDKMFITITVIMYSLLISAESANTTQEEVIEGETFSLTCTFKFVLHHCEWSFNNASTVITVRALKTRLKYLFRSKTTIFLQYQKYCKCDLLY